MSWFRTTWPLCPSLNYPVPVSHRLVKPHFVLPRPFRALQIRIPCVQRFQENLVTVKVEEFEEKLLFIHVSFLFQDSNNFDSIERVKKLEKVEKICFVIFQKKKMKMRFYLR